MIYALIVVMASGNVFVLDQGLSLSDCATQAAINDAGRRTGDVLKCEPQTSSFSLNTSPMPSRSMAIPF